MKRGIGRGGILLLVILFVVLSVEDIYIWIVSGSLPGLEFFAGTLIIIVVFFYAIKSAREHPPPGG